MIDIKVSPNAFARSPWFEGLPESALDTLAASAEIRSMPANSYVYEQGMPTVGAGRAHLADPMTVSRHAEIITAIKVRKGNKTGELAPVVGSTWETDSGNGFCVRPFSGPLVGLRW